MNADGRRVAQAARWTPLPFGWRFPSSGSAGDVHPQIFSVITTMTATAPVKALRAMPGAHKKKGPPQGGPTVYPEN